MPHIPVLLNEVIQFLRPGPGKKYIDATLGRGGHTQAILKAGGEVLGIDVDPSVAAELKVESEKLKVAIGNFGDIKAIAEENGFAEVDGILMDIGLGSHQLDTAERGFSFQREGPLDMRFNQNQKKTARDIVNLYQEKELARIFFKYGEEKRFGRRVARAILERRKTPHQSKLGTGQAGSIQTTTELFELIKQALPAKFRFKAGDTARKIFQALRIEVNDELGNLEKGLQQAAGLLNNNGRLVVISFHSLEDRIVKSFFVKQAKDCVCPPSFPVCRCDARATLRILTKKPVTAGPDEIAANSRSASAKLRAAERI